MTTTYRLFAIVLMLLILTGNVFAGEGEHPNGGEVIQIKQGNVGTFHELRLGVTNIIKTDYIDEAGTKSMV